MKERSLVIILGILNIVFLIICGIFFLGKDKNAPEILLPKGSMVYAEEEGTDYLLEGVTAFDKEDGELTDFVVIEKIVTNEVKDTATITYGVADTSGNVGKATCTVDMTADKESVSEKDSDGRKQNTGMEEDGTASSEERGESDLKQEENEDLTENEDSGENREESGEMTEEDGEVPEENEEDPRKNREETDGESEETDPEEDGEENRSDSEEGEDSETERENSGDGENRNNGALPVAGEAGNTNRNSSLGQNQGTPSMVFRKQEITTKAGSGPAWVNVIEGLHDDKDNYETLLKSLKINGTYDRNKAGTYDITVTVTDSDGNVSKEYPMKIVVEE